MIEDPYKELGLQQGATQEEIKKAYRRMAMRYHPDRNPGNDEAARKMQRVNEAYDMLSNPEKYQAKRAQQQYSQSRQQGYGNPYGQSQQSGHGQQNRGQSYGGWTSDYDFNFEDIFGFGFTGQASTKPTPEPGDSPEIRRVIEYINNGRSQEAIRVLTYIPSTGRNARWYYLSGLANYELGNLVQALDQMQKAAQMDPQNKTYNQLLRQFRQAGQTYEDNAQGFDTHAVNMQKICMGLCFMQLFCGGIPCIRCV